MKSKKDKWRSWRFGGLGGLKKTEKVTTFQERVAGLGCPDHLIDIVNRQ